MNILVTGGCGFIGSNFVRYWLAQHPESRVVVYDKLTYAGRKENLHNLWDTANVSLVVGDIGDQDLVRQTCQDESIDLIVNFAAETHVDQSILGPLVFTDTNVRGTHVLLEVARELGIRLHHISTDEVYGHIKDNHQSVETDELAPRSPYAASKAAADQLVQAYAITYGIPVTITRGANNVGPYQYPEKAVPLFSTNAILGEPIPVYGDGLQMRDYAHVYDHCTGIETVLLKGEIGEVYNVGTGREMTNLEMVDIVLDTLGKEHSMVRHVTDRPGHDRRYSMNVDKLRALGWEPKYDPRQAVAEAAKWYVENRWWWEPIRSGEFREYYDRQYAERLAGTEAR
ncbi:dTDP-glucose 4,6-dehydratase [Deinococcus soli (ex Cha et al. 2016)]|uniref:dTDP-glucose 4,6-dehydratase n=2 Tax=Deinococcus soli (ex Cha et al. 2016) TaxID=1309411 RepID=A0AAE3XCW6_9DEIO|nr:dTDP-glucose 4,6-dehydratase [Deinococcus soli (ex Cha et al. 2016)]MDR6219615.1 dTDP-glucose 4,6-dehydratase [Deinococcus soli (ex Cha et al. 2016)]MDR6329784.1 dTDP-glucose 4,6-dehydratase [Deinococcus soli (ex Cha et al. 2016)]MDR6752523.1 dTDP-glucose 4,6-dehydratase [Deinococcus soli (ex Cha et al. 2016)]